jgi:hypothetical protein
MAPKKKLYTEQNSSRSETAPEVIESDPNNMRRDPNIEESDSLRLFAMENRHLQTLQSISEHLKHRAIINFVKNRQLSLPHVNNTTNN